MRLFLRWTKKLELRPWTTARIPSRSIVTTSSRTDFQQNDAKWQHIWQIQSPQPSSLETKEKKYVLPMFAYPSGSLHMGHLRVYTISDVLARYSRMRGFDVLHPTGWDAFGLPAENAAIERGIDPEAWTLANIEKMKGQLNSMNTSFNWENEISTCSPSFYKHTQQLFLMLYKKGLAYQAEALVNYDPVDKTVLANEQVDSTGRSWRSGALVEQRMLRQWFFRITAFQEALLNDLDVLGEGNRWPDRVIQQQRHWIGRSKGATVQFDVDFQGGSRFPINVFTTRPDTLFGVTYLALSMSHPLVLEISRTNEDLAAFLAKKASFSPDSKVGFELPIRAHSPLTSISSDPLDTVPVFVAPYVLEGYGEGAVMGVPAHDSRDFSFWKQNKPGQTVPVVVRPQNSDLAPNDLQGAYSEPGVLTDKCGKYSGMKSSEASIKIVQDLSSQHLAAKKQTWRLRDWLISRQRYWGTPIPIVHCDSCGAVPVPEDQLPVELPKLDGQIQGQKGNPLDSIDSFVNTDCPSCGKPAKRETDTMDTFVDSSWYYARFPDSSNKNTLFSEESAQRMLPVDIYVGGVEHAILHLLYSRFIFKFLCQEGRIASSDSTLSKEPFSRLIAQGMVHGKTFSDPDTSRFLKADELVQGAEDATPTIKGTSKQAAVSWEKMSKSKHNGVDPLVCFQKYGADVTRAHMLFAAPLSEVLQWDEEKIVGVQRWLYRVSRLVDDLLALSTPQLPAQSALDLTSLTDKDASILLLTNTTLTSITYTIDHNMYNINTVISDLIKLTNALHDATLSTLTPRIAHLCTTTLIKLLAPICPAFAEQCHEDLSLATSPNPPPSIFAQPWPTPLLSPAQITALQSRQTQITCAVQINGKLRFTVRVPAPELKDGKPIKSAAHDDAVVRAVLESEMGKTWLREKHDFEARKRVVVVGGGKVVNVVF